MEHYGLDKPNPDQTWAELEMQLNLDREIVGIALAWKVPNQLGQVMAVCRIDPREAIPCPATDEYPEGYYRIHKSHQTDKVTKELAGVTIPSMWVDRIK